MPSSTTVPAELDRDMHRELSVLRAEVLNHHSSWAALCICLREKPQNLRRLLAVIGIKDWRGGQFDACADAYSVYKDGCTRAKLQH